MTYTPTTDEVRDEWIESGQGSPTVRLHAGAAFDRWLAAHDREVRAQSLREREQQMRLAEEFAATTGRGLAEWLAVVEALSGPPDTPRAEQTREDR